MLNRWAESPATKSQPRPPPPFGKSSSTPGLKQPFASGVGGFVSSSGLWRSALLALPLWFQRTTRAWTPLGKSTRSPSGFVAEPPLTDVQSETPIDCASRQVDCDPYIFAPLSFAIAPASYE